MDCFIWLQNGFPASCRQVRIQFVLWRVFNPYHFTTTNIIETFVLGVTITGFKAIEPMMEFTVTLKWTCCDTWKFHPISSYVLWISVTCSLFFVACLEELTSAKAFQWTKSIYYVQVFLYDIHTWANLVETEFVVLSLITTW